MTNVTTPDPFPEELRPFDGVFFAVCRAVSAIGIALHVSRRGPQGRSGCVPPGKVIFRRMCTRAVAYPTPASKVTKAVESPWSGVCGRGEALFRMVPTFSSDVASSPASDRNARTKEIRHVPRRHH